MKTFCVVLSVLALGACASVATVQAGLVSEYTFDNTLANAVAELPAGPRTDQRQEAQAPSPTLPARSAPAHQLRWRWLVREHDHQWAAEWQRLGDWHRRLLDPDDEHHRNAKGPFRRQQPQPGIPIVRDEHALGRRLDFYLRPDNNSGDYDWQAAASSAFNGNWHHVALTWNATTGAAGTGSATFYLDGTALTTTVSGTENISSTSTWAAWDYGMFIGVGGRATPIGIR